jgi:DNA replication and repair protein RecF
VLTSLNIENVRCLSKVDFAPISGFNLFVGQNGSGKTSILEAIHLSVLGRSFRHQYIDALIQYQMPHLSVSGALKDENNFSHQWGVLKDRENKSTLRINQQAVKSISSLAQLIPLQAIHPRCDELVMGGAKNRRQFMDWGIFHSDGHFHQLWKKGNVLLKQRNSLLKNKATVHQMESWDKVYAECCEEISQKRHEYIESLRPIFEELLRSFERLPEITLTYQRGWQNAETLMALLKKHFFRDLQLGYTTVGFHRDDLLITSQGFPVCETLSRGEQKLLVSVLKLAQGKLLSVLNQKSCIFLLDDFAAELDPEHRFLMIQALSNIGSQAFVTSIEPNEVRDAFNKVNMQMFHVEHRQVNRV